MRVLFLICCFLFVFFFWPHSSEAQCSRGACPMIAAPMQATAHVGVVVARGAVAVVAPIVRPVARVVVAVHERPRVRAAVRRVFHRGCQ